jgi:aspartyl-tRNA(Asn)/glutamyl-tRNA(Gln) amidotransferase subunit C
MISEHDVKKAAKLAKIKFDDAQILHFTEQLGNIMTMIEEMKSVDCINITPLASVCEQTPFTRKDELTERDLGVNLFSNAPGSSSEFAKEIRCFVVPKVVE